MKGLIFYLQIVPFERGLSTSVRKLHLSLICIQIEACVSSSLVKYGVFVISFFIADNDNTKSLGVNRPSVPRVVSVF